MKNILKKSVKKLDKCVKWLYLCMVIRNNHSQPSKSKDMTTVNSLCKGNTIEEQFEDFCINAEIGQYLDYNGTLYVKIYNKKDVNCEVVKA